MKKKIFTRGLALGALMAFAITGSAWAEDLSADTTYTGAKYVSSQIDGQGYSIIVEDKGSTAAKFETNGNAEIINVKDITFVSDNMASMFNMNYGTVAIDGTLTSVNAYIRNTSELEAGSLVISKDLQTMGSGSKLTVHGNVKTGTFSNAGSADVGSIEASSVTNNGSLTVQGAFSTDKLANNGSLYLTSGSLNLPALDFTNTGILKKSAAEKLDTLTVNSLRNKTDLEVGELTTNSYFYNGDQNTKAAFQAEKVIVGGELINYGNGSFTATESVQANSLHNYGTTAAGSVTVNKFSNYENAVAGVGNLSFNNKTGLSNAGVLYVESGIIDISAQDYTNSSGVIKKNETENLAEFKVNSLRNKTDLAVGVLTTNSYFYNGDQGFKAEFEAEQIIVGSDLINYEQGSLIVTDKVQVKNLANRGLADLGDVNVNSFTNMENAVAYVDSLSFDNKKGLSNAGTLYINSGELDISEQVYYNTQGVIQKDADNILDKVTVNSWRNETDFAVGEMTASGYVYNGEAGNASTLTVNNLVVAGGIRNDNGSTLTVGSVESGSFYNTNKAVATVTSLDVSGTLVNNSQAKLNVETLSSEWIDNAASIDAQEVSVYRLLNENDAALSIDNLVMRNSVNDERPWLQLYSSQNTQIGSLGGDNILAVLRNDSGVVNIDNITENTSMDIYMPDTKAGRIIVENNDSNKLSVVCSEAVTNTFSDNIQDGMQKLADTLVINDGNKVKTVYAQSGDVFGDIKGITDNNGNLTVADEYVNQFNQGISEMASIALMTWRQENNDMNKRLGELRDSSGEHGVWLRMTRGESKYGAQSIKNQYNSYQLGYDEKLSVNKNWTVGAALTYTDASSSFSNGKGENKHKGLAVYGSYLRDDGSFIDLIAKYARLEHEFDVNGGAGKGAYDTNGYSISAEYGKRFTQKNGLWFEPQAELTYGKVGSISYITNQGVRVRQAGMDSFVGRVGFAMGKNLAEEKGNVYLRASYLYDFEGETDVAFSKNGVRRNFAQDLGGGWWEVGIGANLNLSEVSHLYFDLEKTYGGNVATPWQWNIGVRWSF